MAENEAINSVQKAFGMDAMKRRIEKRSQVKQFESPAKDPEQEGGISSARMDEILRRAESKKKEEKPAPKQKPETYPAVE